MVCSFGALKLCERHPVNGYTFCLASYYAIGTYSVIGSDRSSVASRALGTSPELAEIISEIVYLGDHLGRFGYCPGHGPCPDVSGLYNTARMSAGGCWGGRWVFYCVSLSVSASGVRADRGGADADAHGSRFPKGAKAGAPPFAFTPGSALLLPPALALTLLGVLTPCQNFSAIVSKPK